MAASPANSSVAGSGVSALVDFSASPFPASPFRATSTPCGDGGTELSTALETEISTALAAALCHEHVKCLQAWPELDSSAASGVLVSTATSGELACCSDSTSSQQSEIATLGRPHR